jgi:thiamine-phosphate pyrophosphorylase
MIGKLQFISNNRTGLTHLESIQTALDAGCLWIQLRIKDESFEQVLQQAIGARKLCELYGAKLIINDYPLIAKEVSAHGLHLGLEDMPIPEARKITGKDMIVGGTANTLAHILLRLKEGADYIGLGPFRFTATKQNLSPVLGMTGFKEIMQQLELLPTSIPVIAIGGILPDDMPDLKATGIHGFAISSALLQAENKKVMVTNIYKTLC